MEEADRDWMMIRMVGGECFFWYRLTRVARTKGRKTIVVVMCFFKNRKLFHSLSPLLFVHSSRHYDDNFCLKGRENVQIARQP